MSENRLKILISQTQYRLALSPVERLMCFNMNPLWCCVEGVRVNMLPHIKHVYSRLILYYIIYYIPCTLRSYLYMVRGSEFNAGVYYFDVCFGANISRGGRVVFTHCNKTAMLSYCFLNIMKRFTCFRCVLW